MMSHKNNSLSDHSDSFPMTRSMSGPNLASINKGEVALPEVSCTEIRPTISASSSHDLLRERSASKDDKDLRRDLFGKITGLLHKSLSGTRRNTSSSQDLTHPLEAPSLSDTTTNSHQVDSNSSKLLHSNKPVKETNRVNLEYDPINKRKVLNTYEILGNIGKGQHGKVKLAKDLEDGELVAIKIVDRKPRKERLKLRKNSNASPEYGNYESKIKREIAIMKRCHHKNIVRLKEVLDDLNSHKIYLVLEYLEKGEIRWKRRLDEKCNNNCDDEIPCRGREGNNHAIEEERDLLSNEYAPNLTFRQSRSIFRDVLLGLEYLHMHGIVHRDIKPANLLVSSENIVKISDFGVSFASSLNKDGIFGNELELAKTAGTPAFFAPELCQTNFSSSGDSRSSSANSLEVLRNDKLKLTKILPRIDHKIDIWALGVTFYAILFGRLPFNADSEFELFQVIVNESVQFPSDRYSFNSPVSVSEEELELAKDLLSKMLEKDSTKRIDIRDIKTHPFILMDLENEIGRLREFFFLNMGPENDFDFSTNKVEISSDEENNAVIGVGNRIRKQVLKTIAHHGMQNNIDLGLPKNDELTGSSSDDLTTLSISGVNPTMLNGESNRSVLLSEALRVSTPPTSSLSTGLKNLQPENNLTTHASSGLSNLVSTAVSRNGSYSLPSTREKTRPHSLWHDMFDSQTASSSRRGSASGPVEAPRIETKRNVVGDLYLKNQSAVDTFKGIQEQDDKRRRSSGVSVQHLSVNVERSSTPNNAVQVTSPIPVSTNRTRSSLNVEPISIDEHRPSPVISLPLNESFASLDSFSDEYLTYKYPDFKKQQAEFIQNYPEASTLDGINARFKNFNLKNSMHSKPPEISMHNYKGEEGEIEPKSSPFRLGKGSGSSISSSSSSTSSSGSEDENDDEEGNLTLAFSSKIAHPSRPPFLSMSQRSKSHDSNLPNLRRYSGNKDQDLPVVYQDGAPEFADIPTSLIPSVSSSSNTTSTLDGKRRHAEWEFFRSNDNSLSSRQHEETSKSSKEQRIQSNGDREADHQRAYKRFFSQDPKVDSLREQFQNHYNKEPVKSSFPHALHLDNDKESRSKVKSRQEYSGTDFHNHNRSNTVTIGVLNRSRNNNKDS